MIIDSLVVELMTRMAQISNILDKHADPSITGPVSMLSKDENGELYFKKGKFYAYTPGETPPQSSAPHNKKICAVSLFKLGGT